MDVPCSVPLKNAWSPVGYQVVEIVDANAPSSPPKSVPVEGMGETKANVASSPVGYRVQLVAEEKGTPRRHLDHGDLHSIQRRRGFADALPWIVTLVPLVFLSAIFLGLLGLAVLSLEVTRPIAAGGNLMVAADPVAVVIPNDLDVIQPGMAPANEVILPPAIEQAPRVQVNEPIGNAAPAGVKPPPIMPPPEFAPPGGAVDNAEGGMNPAGPPEGKGEEFQQCGTSILFARNPKESYRLASASNKLVLLLHVSGNFEENRFT